MKNKTLFLIGYIGIVVALFIFVLRFFFPYHRVIAFDIFLLSSVPFGFALYRSTRIRKAHGKAKSKIEPFVKYRRPVILTSLVLILFLGFLKAFPLNNFHYFGLGKDVLRKEVALDIENLLIYSEGQREVTHLFLENRDLLQSDFESLTKEDKEYLMSLWASYMSYSKELDSLTQRHKYFYQINFFEEPELTSKSFLIAYNSFLSNYNNFLILSKEINTSVFLKALFNEENAEYSLEKDSYLHFSNAIFDINNTVKLEAGKGSLAFFEKFRKELSSEEKLLIADAKKAYSLNHKLGGNNSHILLDVSLDYFERNTFDAWFPAQRSFAEGTSYLKLSLRDKYIDQRDLLNLKKRLEPGDIFVQKRHWQLTNVGIPGYWTHSALYLGEYDEFVEFFADIISEEELAKKIEKENKDFFEDFKSGEVAVIESLRDGVILQSLEQSATADYLGVMRPNIEKQAKLEGLLSIFQYYGRPYDYNFDFITDEALVCSELIYKAFHIRDKKEGVPFDLELASGRLLMSPNNIVKQFDLGLKGLYLDFIAFLNYDGEDVFFDTEENFRKTWKGE